MTHNHGQVHEVCKTSYCVNIVRNFKVVFLGINLIYMPVNWINWRCILAEMFLKFNINIVGLLCQAIPYYSFMFVCFEIVKNWHKDGQVITTESSFFLENRERRPFIQCDFFSFLERAPCRVNVFITSPALSRETATRVYLSVPWKKLVSDDSDRSESFACFKY